MMRIMRTFREEFMMGFETSLETSEYFTPPAPVIVPARSTAAVKCDLSESIVKFDLLLPVRAARPLT